MGSPPEKGEKKTKKRGHRQTARWKRAEKKKLVTTAGKGREKKNQRRFRHRKRCQNCHVTDSRTRQLINMMCNPQLVTFFMAWNIGLFQHLEGLLMDDYHEFRCADET